MSFGFFSAQRKIFDFTKKIQIEKSERFVLWISSSNRNHSIGFIYQIKALLPRANHPDRSTESELKSNKICQYQYFLSENWNKIDRQRSILFFFSANLFHDTAPDTNSFMDKVIWMKNFFSQTWKKIWISKSLQFVWTNLCQDTALEPNCFVKKIIWVKKFSNQSLHKAKRSFALWFSSFLIFLRPFNC